MAKLLTQCPVCENALHVTELTCGRCATHVGGVFAVCRFCRATPEHLTFIETFLRCEGNLSRVEKILGVSYPTVRNRLAAALNALGLSGDETETEPELARNGTHAHTERRDILEQLARGDVDAETAAERLRDLYPDSAPDAISH